MIKVMVYGWPVLDLRRISENYFVAYSDIEVVATVEDGNRLA